MTSTSWGLILALCFLVSLLGTRVAVALLWRGGVIDTPNGRSSHDRPVPRGGGIVFVTVFLAGIALTTERFDGMAIALLVAGALVAAVGLVDDLRPLPVLPRLLAHVGAGLCVSILVEGSVTLGPWGLAPLADHLFVTFVVVAFINAFNFMDGIDGLTASHAVVTAAAVSVLALLASADQLTRAGSLLAAAVAGFLVWNWPPAKLFMGDVGSGFLGFVLAALSVTALRRGIIGAIPVLVVQAVFLIDTGATMARRVHAGERWFAPHRSHAYQRAAAAFGSHRPVVLAIIVMDLLFATLAVLVRQRPATTLVILSATVVGGSAMWWAVQRESDRTPQPNGKGTLK